jgi:hypothetical protein
MALLLQCLQGNPDPEQLGMHLASAPRDMVRRPGTPVYRAEDGKAIIYQFTAGDPTFAKGDDCSISAYNVDSISYLNEIVGLMESPRWNYKVVRHRKPANDGATETITLQGPGRTGRGLLTIFALPPNWRSMNTMLLSQGMLDAFYPYSDVDVYRGYKSR